MEDIVELINKGESETVEFKQSFNKETVESLAAFANTKGGCVFVGVKDNGDICGVDLGSESLQKYANQIKSSTEPSLIVDIQTLQIKDQEVLVITVGEFPIKPVSFKGKFFKRVANSVHQMNLTEISTMHMQSLQLSWDAYPSNDIQINELDMTKVSQFINRVNENGRFKLKGTEIECLKKLNLIKEKQAVNAAKLLFSKDQNVYNIHIGRFKTPSMILDDKMIKATLYDAVEKTMLYILSHIKVAFQFTGELQRTEILEYPTSALRELVLNAIVHRDYVSPVDIQIKIFDQSITIFNPGKLYGDMTIEKLKTDNYQSRTRNKLIAEAFYLTKDIEKYGSGYIRVREAIKEFNTMMFDYEESGDGYLVTLSYTEQKTTQETAQENTKEKIIQLLKENSYYTKNDLMKILGKGDGTIKEHLANLKKEGKLERKGSTKSGYWKVLE